MSEKPKPKDGSLIPGTFVDLVCKMWLAGGDLGFRFDDQGELVRVTPEIEYKGPLSTMQGQDLLTLVPPVIFLREFGHWERRAAESERLFKMTREPEHEQLYMTDQKIRDRVIEAEAFLKRHGWKLNRKTTETNQPIFSVTEDQDRRGKDFINRLIWAVYCHVLHFQGRKRANTREDREKVRDYLEGLGFPKLDIKRMGPIWEVIQRGNKGIRKTAS